MASIAKMESVHDFSAQLLDGREIQLSEFSGKLLLIVNTASKCGFTPQYEGLEQLYQRYKDRGLEILAFPCNQFAAQEPGNAEEIAQTCRVRYGVSFPVFSKIQVNGKDAHPLYRHLKAKKGSFPSRSIKWNFTKFLVGRDGEVLERFGPATTPASLEPMLEKLLK